MKKLVPLILAAALLIPAFASAQTCNPECSAPKTCVADNQCGYAAGSPAANCLSTCSGQCTISANGSATCGTGSSASSGTTGNGACFGNEDCASGYTCDLTIDTCVNSSGAVQQGPSTYGTGGISNTSGTGVGGGINQSYIQGYGTSITGIINGILVPLLVAVAFIVFLWCVFKYFILGAANEEDRKTGTQFVLYGIVGFVIIFSLWGLVNLLMGTLNLSTGGTHPVAPTL